jgi:hypothetical protein
MMDDYMAGEAPVHKSPAGQTQASGQAHGLSHPDNRPRLLYQKRHVFNTIPKLETLSWHYRQIVTKHLRSFQPVSKWRSGYLGKVL